jgi:drug/metabolite transporter (DMT)-like permease
MVNLVLGIAAAVGSSTLYSLGIALQAVDAREAPHEEHLRPSLARRLVRRPRWLLGTGLSILGWPLQVLALLLAPLVVVQPALAAGLLVLLYLGERMLGERPGRYEWLCVCAIVLGVVGAALTHPPRSTSHTSEQLTITLVLIGLGLASLLPYLLHAFGRSIAEMTMVGAGLAFGWSAVATKLAADDLAGGHYVAAAAWGLSTAAASGIGVLSEMSALQARPAIQVAPVVFVTQTVVPLILAPLLLGESFSATPGGGVPLAISLGVLIGGAAALGRSPLLLGLTDADRVSEASGSTPSPCDSTQETIRSSPDSEDGEPPSSTTITSPARIVR